ncbi:MAG TPA: hypothetical protein VN372_01200 [Methanospirillum sp.]|nr:hypothetical protein [Methanospirillum sp.]
MSPLTTSLFSADSISGQSPIFVQEHEVLLLGSIILVCGILMIEIIPFFFGFEHAGLHELKERMSQKLLIQGCS